MRRYYFFYFFILLVSVGCFPERFADNERLGFEVNVVDENNKPIENIEVILSFSDGDSSSNGVIAENITDSNGFVNLISLSPGEDNDEFSLIINNESGSFQNFNTIDESLGGVRYNFLGSSLESNTIEIPTTLLRRSATLNLEILNTSGSSNSIDFLLILEAINQIFNLTEGSSSTTLDIDDSLTPLELPFSIEIPTLLNTTAIFSYQIRDVNGNAIETETLEILIDQETTNYVFEF